LDSNSYDARSSIAITISLQLDGHGKCNTGQDTDEQEDLGHYLQPGGCEKIGIVHKKWFVFFTFCFDVDRASKWWFLLFAFDTSKMRHQPSAAKKNGPLNPRLGSG
jgi:hypothetical protein